MKITRVETFRVPPRWLFCRIETDEGITGWGEPIIEGRAEVVQSAVNVLSEYLIGRDPLRIEDHWQVMTKAGFYRGGPIMSSAVAGIDQALWDIAGKTLGVPVHQLLGGAVRDAVRVYGWIGGDDPEEVADAAREQIEAGFTAVKMNGSGRLTPVASPGEITRVIERAETVREVLGPERDLALDFHGRMSVINARRILPQLEHLNLLFAEEPLLPEHIHLLPEITRSTTVPVALGERLFSRAEFLPALRGGLAVAQPDLSHAGGITEVRKIASLAEVYDVVMAPHCPLGPIALAACLQIAFTTPNFLIQEQSIGIHYNSDAEVLDYVLDSAPFTFVAGQASLPTGIGLGIDIDEHAVRLADKSAHRWRNPIWRNLDGSLAEW